ncbi:acetamidase/formamidase family protein [Pseudomonas sp. JS3066]|jgi:acetamidase/formamidase|uniref:acetamidase/formamidase family protein n=1 Tax=unclassified Pseudomonas TaxID=196821 RepID=UPI000EA87E00|nr:MULTISPECIES: acetamidase/formamidase family protein [unclassified Pseudomonas]AYF86814.1 acetamidase [Pseudomonas sp. DY-1]MDH4652225.1 acetamidase [Pseudomonas sp. BN606]MRK21868.1 acetamidase [Pseudomonas sp. JG-B]WVK95696.1 acetamidase/formamidase family protein [Pseudomonas sp. JS3066]
MTRSLPDTKSNQPAVDRLNVRTYTNGIVGPSLPMLGPLANGGTLITGTPPGCWGPMITPAFQGGHEVTQPVAIEGAEVGDAVALKIIRMRVTSLATSSGVMKFVEGRYHGDPFVSKFCAKCGTEHPASHVEGIGEDAIRCNNCGAEVSAFRFGHGYVIVLDQENQVSLTVNQEVANGLAGDASQMSALPALAEQHSILSLARADMPGVAAHMRPFLGNIGTTPSRDIPDSHNCADFGQYLVGAPHRYGLSEEELHAAKTDGHMDTNSVREGCILICPVKVPGAGVYMGDMHAQQGNGEIAGHATDVSGETELTVEVIKNLTLEGPILLQNLDDLPPMARPMTAEQRRKVQDLGARWGQHEVERNGPITFIGSGKNLNAATENGLERAAAATGLPYDEVLNRATITGSIEISRLPGTVRVTLLCPMDVLDRMGIGHLVREKYQID